MECTNVLRRRDENGAVLLIAILFLAVGSLLVVSLGNLSGTNLLNTSVLQAQRTFEYAADAGMDGALQSVRYHGSCETFPTAAGTFKVSNYYVAVSCTGTQMTGATVNGTALTISTGSFVPADVGQQVYDPKILGGFTTIASYVSPTQMTLVAGAIGSDSNAVVGNSFERLDLLTACVSTSSISSCPTSQAVITAVVDFKDTDSSGNPGQTGFNMTILSWTVNTAQG